MKWAYSMIQTKTQKTGQGTNCGKAQLQATRDHTFKLHTDCEIYKLEHSLELFS